MYRRGDLLPRLKTSIRSVVQGENKQAAEHDQGVLVGPRDVRTVFAKEALDATYVHNVSDIAMYAENVFTCCRTLLTNAEPCDGRERRRCHACLRRACGQCGRGQAAAVDVAHVVVAVLDMASRENQSRRKLEAWCETPHTTVQRIVLSLWHLWSSNGAVPKVRCPVRGVSTSVTLEDVHCVAVHLVHDGKLEPFMPHVERCGSEIYVRPAGRLQHRWPRSMV